MDNQQVKKQPTVSEISIDLPIARLYYTLIEKTVITVFLFILIFSLFTNINIFLIFILVSIIIFLILHIHNRKKIKNIIINPLGISIEKYKGQSETILWQDIKNISIIMKDGREIDKNKKVPLSLKLIMIRRIRLSFQNVYHITDCIFELNSNKTISYKISYAINDSNENNLLNMLYFYSNKYKIQSNEYNLFVDLTVPKREDKLSSFIVFFITALLTLIIVVFALLVLFFVIDIIKNKDDNVIFIIPLSIFSSIFFISLSIYGIKILWIRFKNLLKK